jgi:hypothetical protein
MAFVEKHLSGQTIYPTCGPATKTECLTEKGDCLPWVCSPELSRLLEIHYYLLINPFIVRLEFMLTSHTMPNVVKHRFLLHKE